MDIRWRSQNSTQRQSTISKIKNQNIRFTKVSDRQQTRPRADTDHRGDSVTPAPTGLRTRHDGEAERDRASRIRETQTRWCGQRYRRISQYLGCVRGAGRGRSVLYRLTGRTLEKAPTHQLEKTRSGSSWAAAGVGGGEGLRETSGREDALILVTMGTAPWG